MWRKKAFVIGFSHIRSIDTICMAVSSAKCLTFAFFSATTIASLKDNERGEARRQTDVKHRDTISPLCSGND